MDNNKKILTAAEGKILYNGVIYVDKVFIGDLDSEDNWQERPYEEYEQWLQSLKSKTLTGAKSAAEETADEESTDKQIAETEEESDDVAADEEPADEEPAE